MTYHERQAGARGALFLDGERVGYDIDWFGMDDGQDRDPDAAFRFLFQLGQGYMIYLYVIGVGQPGSGAWFHTFWTKDCAVAEVEMEEHGPPSEVRCERRVLPALYETFVLERAGGERRFDVGEATFEARFGASEKHLEVRFALRDAGAPAELAWSPDGFRLVEEGRVRPLVAGERVTFRGPIAG